MAERFFWSPEARVRDAAGRKVEPRGSECPAGAGLCEIADHPADLALSAVYRAIAAGRELRLVPSDKAGSGAGEAEAGEAGFFQAMSSGTTGGPRAVRRRQQSWVRSFEVNAGLWRMRPSDSSAVLGRLSHSLAFYAAAEALYLGLGLELLHGLRPDRQRAEIASRGVSLLYATPAQLRLLCEAPGATLDGLRLILVGGSKLDPALRHAVGGLAPRADLHEFYGASETSFVTVSGLDTPDSSVGKAYPGVRIGIRGPDGRVLPAGQEGEIWVESPYLFEGYARGGWGDTRREGAALTVGEMGHLDGEGHLYIAGRRSRMVTIADQNVFPEAIESFLTEQPGVGRAAVLARPDERRGHVLMAFVVPVPDAGFEPDALLRVLRRRFGPLVAPRSVRVIGRLPVLASGKTDLVALAREFEGTLR